MIQMKNVLLQKKCVPCEGGMPTLSKEKIQMYLGQLKNPWEVVDGIKIKYRFRFKNFKEAMLFVNKVASIANKEDHHPNIFIAYNKVSITCTTHVIGGLSENDFIIAAKIEKLV